MKILIFGASGMVGQGVLREALRDTDVAEVVTIGRTASGRHDAKLREIVRADPAAIDDLGAELTGIDACFFCLGVSAVGMAEADYRRVTHDLTLRIAGPLARAQPGMTFIYVSGAGTRIDSRMMWARVKGGTEAALTALPFAAVYLFRPGFIQPLHGIRSKTGWYNAIYALTAPIASLLGVLAPGAVTTTERLGRAMIMVARRGYPKRVLDNGDINSAARAPG